MREGLHDPPNWSRKASMAQMALNTRRHMVQNGELILPQRDSPS
jgi:hypothetical protein